MASTREIKQRIKNIQSVAQLIQAMHMVASTQLRHVNRQLEGAIPVQEGLRRKINEFSRVEEARDCPYHDHRKIKHTLFIVFTGDRGLAGAYNSKVQKFALDQMQGLDEKIVIIGSYGRKFFEKQKKNIVRAIVDIPDSKIYYGSESLALWVTEGFLNKEWDEVYMVYTEFENVLTSHPKMVRLLPLPLDEVQPPLEIFQPSLRAYLDAIVPFYLHMSIFRAFSEAHTSEQASRMLAMDTAGNNARDLVEDLQRNLNRQRQQEITQELAEIVGQKS